MEEHGPPGTAGRVVLPPARVWGPPQPSSSSGSQVSIRARRTPLDAPCVCKAEFLVVAVIRTQEQRESRRGTGALAGRSTLIPSWRSWAGPGGAHVPSGTNWLFEKVMQIFFSFN